MKYTSGGKDLALRMVEQETNTKFGSISIGKQVKVLCNFREYYKKKLKRYLKYFRENRKT